MCVAIPGKVIKLFDNKALVEFNKIRKVINTSLVEDLKPGDYVLVHVGCAIDKMDKNEAIETLEVFRLLGIFE
ncbi:MAG: HypC/HybG/HupF family hydrogenase formation chaperone [Clostridium sp.]